MYVLFVAQLVEHTLGTHQDPGSSPGQGKFFWPFWGFSKMAILNMIIPFWLLTLHSMKRYFLGKKLYLNKKYFLKYRWCDYGIQLN